MRISVHQHARLALCGCPSIQQHKLVRSEFAGSICNRPSYPAETTRSTNSCRWLYTYGCIRQRLVAVAQAIPTQMASSPKPKGPSPVEGRRMLLKSLPLESFKTVGVSFEGRQQLVGQLKPGENCSWFWQPAISVLLYAQPCNTILSGCLQTRLS